MSQEGKAWFKYIEESVSEADVEAMVKEFLDIMDKVPSKLKKKVMAQMNHRTPDGDRQSSHPEEANDSQLAALVASSGAVRGTSFSTSR
jgi:hypothetical protein